MAIDIDSQKFNKPCCQYNYYQKQNKKILISLYNYAQYYEKELSLFVKRFGVDFRRRMTINNN